MQALSTHCVPIILNMCIRFEGCPVLAEFLVDRKGHAVARFGPSFDPLNFEGYVSFHPLPSLSEFQSLAPQTLICIHDLKKWTLKDLKVQDISVLLEQFESAQHVKCVRKYLHALIDHQSPIQHLMTMQKTLKRLHDML